MQQAEARCQRGLVTIRKFGDTIEALNAVELLAAIAASAQDSIRAGKLLAAAAQIRQEKNIARWSSLEASYQESIHAVRAQLGANKFEQEWKEGAALSLEETIYVALRKD